MTDETFKALADMEASGWTISGGTQKPAYEAWKANNRDAGPATCKTCGGTLPNCKPSPFDPNGVGDPAHKMPADGRPSIATGLYGPEFIAETASGYVKESLAAYRIGLPWAEAKAQLLSDPETRAAYELECVAMNIVHQIGDALYEALPKDVAHDHLVHARIATNDAATDFIKDAIRKESIKAQQRELKILRPCVGFGVQLWIDRRLAELDEELKALGGAQ